MNDTQTAPTRQHSTLDTKTALEAQTNITWIANHWDDLTARLTPGSSTSSSEVRAPSPEPQLPIDTHISDLMAEIDWKIARHYCNTLVEETDDVKSVPTTADGRLRLVAERYGHFVMDDRTALQFCDEAEDYQGRVSRALDRPVPSRFWGECASGECPGKMYMREDAAWATCPECGTKHTLEDMRRWIYESFEGLLLEYSEIMPALKILDREVSVRTVQRWTRAGDSYTQEQREKAALKPALSGEPVLYSLRQAVELVEKNRKYTGVDIQEGVAYCSVG